LEYLCFRYKTLIVPTRKLLPTRKREEYKMGPANQVWILEIRHNKILDVVANVLLQLPVLLATPQPVLMTCLISVTRYSTIWDLTIAINHIKHQFGGFPWKTQILDDINVFIKPVAVESTMHRLQPTSV
jgi:hypothetical protein